jgi:CHASE2 domain-containing sensor protein
VLVKIDDQSLRDVGRWPWPRRRYAEVTDRLTKAGAKRIFFDLTFDGPTTRADDQLFADAIERSGRVILAARTRTGQGEGTQEANLQPLMTSTKAQIGSISWRYNYRNAVSQIPYSAHFGGEPVASFASLLSGRPQSAKGGFTPDY